MKKTACLLLCLLILLLCCSCKKEESVPQLNKGTLYTSADITYNTDVRMTLATKELTAPVSELTFELRNDTDYIVAILNNPDKYPLEKWENEEWKLVERPWEGGVHINRAFICCLVDPHSPYLTTEDFSKYPLEAGLYRLQATINVTDAQKKLELPRPLSLVTTLSYGTRCIAELYFTILPAPEA